MLFTSCVWLGLLPNFQTRTEPHFIVSLRGLFGVNQSFRTGFHANCIYSTEPNGVSVKSASVTQFTNVELSRSASDYGLNIMLYEKI